MIKEIKLEFFKIRHRKMYITTLAIMGVLFLWNLFAQSRKDSILLSEQGWMNLFYSFATMNCILMPILTAVVASKLVDIEHKGNTLKLLKTVQGSRNLFISKLICGIIIMFISVCLEALSMIVLSVIGKYSNAIPYSYLVYFMFYTFLIDITLLLIQIILSFQFVNQMIAFVVAITGSFLGLFSLFFSGIISKIILWSYYANMMIVKMNWDKDTRIVSYSWCKIPYLDIILVICILIIIYIYGQKLFDRGEE